jgi:hypothetical protein
MEKALVTVVIPLRLEEPTELEKISLAQTLTVLHRYPIALMAPTGLDTSWYEERCQGHANVRIERFDWHGYEAFTMLMMDPLFYKRFWDYEYMLICHLDAFVFRDELAKWCHLGYDYMGAVVYSPDFWNENTRLRRLTGFTNPEYIGNGGFALKKIRAFHHMLTKYRVYISLYHRMRKWRGTMFFDDLFLAVHFPKLSSRFRIAPKFLAQQFGVDSGKWREEDLPFTNEDNDTLPFGVHGWIQHNLDYWEPCIERYGYRLRAGGAEVLATAE